MWYKFVFLVVGLCDYQGSHGFNKESALKMIQVLKYWNPVVKSIQRNGQNLFGLSIIPETFFSKIFPHIKQNHVLRQDCPQTLFPTVFHCQISSRNLSAIFGLVTMLTSSRWAIQKELSYVSSGKLMSIHLFMCVWVAQQCLILCNPMDCGLPGPSVHGIPQARILEWIAIPFFRGSSWPSIKLMSPTLHADSLPSEPPGKPSIYLFSLSCNPGESQNHFYSLM